VEGRTGNTALAFLSIHFLSTFLSMSGGRLLSFDSTRCDIMLFRDCPAFGVLKSKTRQNIGCFGIQVELSLRADLTEFQ
jgi:hypothetical protein